MRFHSKKHNFNHFSEPVVGYPDSASDPIASHDSPFKGDFVIDGSIYANAISLSDSISSLEVDSLVVTNSLSSLSVETLTLTSFGSNTDGSNLINVNATTLDGFDSLAFEVVSNKDIAGGYLGIDVGGNITATLANMNLSSLNFIAVDQYLTEFDLSSTVAPLITSDNAIGYEIPDEFLPSHITELSSINGVGLGDYLISTDIGSTVQAYDATILTNSDIGSTVKGEWVAPPTLSSDSGSAGDFAYDSDYLYICVATDTWRRVDLTGW